MAVHGTKKKKILVCGLPGSGKTTLARVLAPMLGAQWLNADEVRKEANDWDFSPEGRTRQANRMKEQAQAIIDNNLHVLCDFVCPTEKTREDFGADYVVWMDTIKEKKQMWDNKKPTAQMLGRWQPWHAGHQKLFEEILKKTGQVLIMVREVQGVVDNPFNFETVKSNIEKALKDYEGKFKIILVPNITNICYGRGVGYKIEEIVLDEETQRISATEIRMRMREEGKLGEKA